MRPVAITRAYGSASSGVISGFGLAIANTIASRFILCSASGSITRAPESPTNRSAPSITSAGAAMALLGVGASANQRLTGGIVPS